MEIKFLEIRDRHTTIIAMAMRTVPSTPLEYQALRRCGYPPDAVILMRLSDCEAKNDPYEWKAARTMPQAHEWLYQHWDEIKTGEVLDVEFILKEKPTPKLSEVLIG